jgi:tRNA U38,U39,U40 pseudouridine synthase TruA
MIELPQGVEKLNALLPPQIRFVAPKWVLIPRSLPYFLIFIVSLGSCESSRHSTARTRYVSRAECLTSLVQRSQLRISLSDVCLHPERLGAFAHAFFSPSSPSTHLPPIHTSSTVSPKLPCRSFRITPEALAHIRGVLAQYVGTHNFHNFTSRVS